MRPHRLSDPVAGDPDDSLLAQRSTIARNVLAAGRAAAFATALLFGATPVFAGIFGVPTNLNANGTLSGTSANPPGFFILTSTDTLTTSGDSVHQMKFFIEVTGTTLDVKVFDPGSNLTTARDSGLAVNTQYRLFNPAGTLINTLTIGNDTGGTDNRLARLSCNTTTGGTATFTAANAGTVFGTGLGACAALSPGLYELRVTATTTTADRYNAFGLDIRDNSGSHYNVFTYGSSDSTTTGAPAATETSFIAGAMNVGGTPVANIAQPMVLYPYVNRGCSVETTNFDMDSATTGAGSNATITDTAGVSTALTMSANAAHAEDIITVEPVGGVNLDSQNYGIYSISNDTGTQDNRAIDWRLADWRGAANLGANLPRNPTSAIRTYLPNDYGTAPVEPILVTSARLLSGANPPQVGSATTFVVTTTLFNPGPGAITNAAINAAYPNGLGVAASLQCSVDGTVEVGPTCVTATGTSGVFRNVTLTRAGSLAAGSALSLSYQVTFTPAAGGLQNLTAPPSLTAAQTVSATYTPTSSSATFTRSDTLGPICQMAVVAYVAADLALTVADAPDPVTPGSNITYTLQVTNNGPSAAPNATVTDTLPPGTTFVSAAAPGGWACSTPAAGGTGTLSCSVASLASAASATITLTIQVPPGTAAGAVITDTATTSHSGIDSVSANNTATTTTTVAAASANLSVTKTDSPDPVQAGANITYSVLVANAGPSNAANVQLSDVIAAPTNFQALSFPAGWVCSTPGVGATGTITCTRASLGSGASASFSIVVQVNGGTASGTNINNTASVSSTTADPGAGDNSATATTIVAPAPGAAPVCATPGKDGPGGVLAGVINTYYPGTANAAAAATTITVGTSTGAGQAIGIGDLLLVMQMQDAAINSNNDERYGDGSGTALNTTGNGSGSTSLNNAGLYEFVRAASAIPATGGTVTIFGTGVGNGLLNAYTNAAATGTQGQRRFQVVRVPQYSTATLGSTLTASAWNGTTGGILVFDVAGTLNLGSATASVSGRGFRGGGARQLAGGAGGANTDYRSAATNNFHASKGEGVAGTPRFVYTSPTLFVTSLTSAGTTATVTTLVAHGFATGNTVIISGATQPQYNGSFVITVTTATTFTYTLPAVATSPATGTLRAVNQAAAVVTDTGVEGYPNGSMARGAPGNAGGGGNDGNPSANDENSGGGGGANGGGGGQGGNTWNSNLPVGGFGGVAFTSATGRISLGGGGGAGTRNNSANVQSSGGAGGGIVIVRAGVLSGTGVIRADGDPGVEPDNDGGGGGGAGGSVVFVTASGTLTGLTVSARGGNGSHAWPLQAPNGTPGDRHGPGGGGGGGVLLLSSAPTASDVSGGANGITTTANSAFSATAGVVGTVATPAALPGLDPGATCGADVSIVKTDSPDPALLGQTLTYSLVVTNNGFRTATSVIATDPLPVGNVSFVSAISTQGTCSFASPTLTCAIGTLLTGASATVTVTTTTTATGTPSNTATVTRTEADPDSTNDTSTVSSTINPAADMAVTISDAPDPVDAGNLITYSIGVSNNGPSTAANPTLTLVTPSGTTFGSITPPPGWTCTTPLAGASGTITCTAVSATLASGGAAAFSLDLQVDPFATQGTLITASAGVSTTTAETVLTNNQASTTTSVNAAVLLLTRATIRGLRVDPSGVVEFVTGTQKNTRSFNLYATDDRSYDGERTLLNATPVLSPRPDSMMAILYRVETSPISGRYILIEETETTGKVFTYGPYSVVNRALRRGLEAVEAQMDRFGVPAGPVRVSRVAFDTREEMHARTRALVVRARRAAERVTRSASRSERGERDSSRSDGLRIEVAGSGETVIPVSTLLTEGMPDVPWRKLRLTSGGRPVSFERAMRAGVDSLVFRAETLTTDFTDENVYVLSWGSTPPAPSIQLTSSSDPLRPGVTRVERDSIYNATFIGDRWLWDLLIGDGTTWPYPEWDPTAGRFDLPRLASAGPGLVPVKIKLVGASDTSHQVSARINGVDVGSSTFAGLAPGVIEGSVPLGSLRASGNELALTYSARNADGTPSDSGYVYLDYVDLEAPMIPPASTALVTDIRAYESDLPSFGGVRYLIVTHPLFRAQADRLAALKTAEGLKAVVVETETAYDRFSSGIEDPQAIAALIRYAAAASSKLTYAVLFGDDTLDPRNHLGGGGIAYVPSILGPDAYSLVPNENAYADVDKDGRPDIALGRLPVTTIEEATDMVDKIENQAATLLASRNVHVFVSDAPGAAGADFAQQAEEMAALLPEASTAVLADAGAGVGTARTTLFGSWQQGVTATHYFGHGGPEIWTDHALFSVDDVPALLDHMPPSMLFMWACQSQYFQYYYAPSLGEALFLLPRSGTVSSFGPVGITSTLGQRAIYRNVYKNLYKRGLSIGEIIRQAKLAALDGSPRNQDVVNSFMLFGDPSLTLDPSPRRPRP